MSKPQQSYSSSRLDLTGESITDMARTIATSQPWLEWLHAGRALAVYRDPYVLGILRNPVAALASVYSMQAPDNPALGRDYLDALFSEELGHHVTEADLIIIGAKLFKWLEARLTGFRVQEMIRYLSAADSTEKLIAGSLIKEASDAFKKHQEAEDVNPETLPQPIQDQILAFKEEYPEAYQLILEDIKRLATRGAAIGNPIIPLSHPVVGERDREAAKK